MAYKMNKAQFDSVIQLSGPDRYKHFISRIADWQEVWTLKQSDGYVTFGDDAGHICVPVWPHSDYAAALASGEWVDCASVAIELDSFRRKWLPGILKDGYLIAVFPTPNQKGVVVTAGQLVDDLNNELSRIE